MTAVIEAPPALAGTVVEIPERDPEEERYGIYELRRETCFKCRGSGTVFHSSISDRRACPECRGRGRIERPVCVATVSTAAAIGSALITLADDRHDAGLRPAVFGIKDNLESRWVSTLWQPRLIETS